MTYKEALQSNNNDLHSNNTDLQTILDTINALPEAGGTVVETATVTVALNRSVCHGIYYTDVNGVQSATHENSPFICAVPSMLILDYGIVNYIASTTGKILKFRQLSDCAVFEITGDGTITLTPNSGGSDD